MPVGWEQRGTLNHMIELNPHLSVSEALQEFYSLLCTLYSKESELRRNLVSRAVHRPETRGFRAQYTRTQELAMTSKEALAHLQESIRDFS